MEKNKFGEVIKRANVVMLIFVPSMTTIKGLDLAERATELVKEQGYKEGYSVVRIITEKNKTIAQSLGIKLPFAYAVYKDGVKQKLAQSLNMNAEALSYDLIHYINN